MQALPRLLGGRALAHLLFVADDSPGILAADAEIDRNIEAAVVNAADLLEHVEIGRLEPLLKPGHGFLRRAGLVLIISVLFPAGLQGDDSFLHELVREWVINRAGTDACNVAASDRGIGLGG